MACVNPDGTLAPSALTILATLNKGASTAADLARQMGLPVYRIRSSMRELVEAKLVLEENGTPCY
ncbi:MAG: hypothetical protein M1546_09335 [Chloroflexi bacterium]|nr:hypothetical protein [Chloroflexota bacterium]